MKRGVRRALIRDRRIRGRTRPREVWVYHRTSEDAARAILYGGRWTSLEHDGAVYFSNRSSGHAADYGPVCLAVRVPAQLLTPDDEFPDGEVHYRVDADRLAGRPRRIVRT